MRLTSSPRPDLTARRALAATEARRGDVTRQLSTGLAVGRGRDAPAKLIAGEVLRQDRAKADAVAAGAGSAAAAATEAEAALAEVNTMLLELRRLAGASYGDTLGVEERAANQMQADRLVAEIDRTLADASYKGRPLFRPPPPRTAAAATPPLSLAGQPIGPPAIPGSHTTDGAGTFTLTGNGYHGGGRDRLYIAARDQSGDAVIEATVQDFANVSGSGVAGGALTFRAPGTANDALSVYLFRNDTGRVWMRHRTTPGGDGTTTAGVLVLPDTPTTLRLTRDGNTFTGTASGDGVTFQTVGSVSVPLPPTARAGLFATPNSNSVSQTVTFTDVGIVEGLTPPSELPPPLTGGVPRPEVGTLPGDPTDPEQSALVFNLGTTSPGALAALRLTRADARTLGRTAGGPPVGAIASGGALALTDPANADEAARAVDAAVAEVSVLRGRLGNFERNLVAPMRRQGTRLSAELADARSQVVDTPFARATAELARLDVLRQGAADVMAVGFAQQRQVLDLLG